jgi:hypothetical protein
MRAVYSVANNSNIQVDADYLGHETGRVDTGGVGVSQARTPPLYLIARQARTGPSRAEKPAGDGAGLRRTCPAAPFTIGVVDICGARRPGTQPAMARRRPGRNLYRPAPHPHAASVREVVHGAGTG